MVMSIWLPGRGVTMDTFPVWYRDAAQCEEAVTKYEADWKVKDPSVVAYAVCVETGQA